MAEMYMMAAMLAARRRAASLKGMIKLVEANIDQASVILRSAALLTPAVYKTTCLTLGSTIETAIGMKAVPSPSHMPELLWIVEEVYRRKTILLEPSLMMLMMHIKSACHAGWFSDKDKEYLILMADQASLGYSNIDNMDIETTSEHTISDIISRFYPRMRVVEILTSFTVQAGEGAEANFYIAPNTVPNQNVWLLVARTDNIDTAACLTTPSNADFVINQSGVPNRTRKNMGKGPQLPSNVTKLVNDGVNCLKVFGEFDGEYVIAIAYMNLMSSSDPPQLQDYIHPVSGDASSDCVIAEKISLICPSSGCRIITPVKGRLCKHFQCIDYEFFMKANSIRPTWKCPLPRCRKPISNLDIRIDQKFLKILNEVAESVSNVYISDEGSWTVELADIRHINGDTINQQIHVPDNSENLVSLEARETPMSLYDEGNSAISMTVEPSAVEQATVTTPAVSSPPQAVKDSSLMPQGSGDMVNTPSPIQETRHHLDPVNSAPAQLSEEIQLQNSQADQASEPESSASIIRRARGIIDQARRTTMVIPVQLTPLSAPPAAMELRNRSKPNVGTTNQAQDNTLATAVKLRRGRKQRKISTLCQSAPAQTSSPVPTPASFTRPASPTRLQEPSEDAISCLRMRGGLEGEKLEAARLALLAPPKQPIEAPDPWSIPLPGIPMEVLMSRPPNQ